MNWIVTAYESVGPVKLGMSIEEARGLFDKPPDLETKTADHYATLGISIQYKDGKVAHVEFSGPENPVVQGKSLLDLNAGTAVDWLEREDEDTQQEMNVYISEKLGIALFISEEVVASIGVFVKDYYKDVL